jgi:hypothetical protein
MVKIGRFVMITLCLYSTENLALNGSAYVASVPTPNPGTKSTSTAIYMNNCLGFSFNELGRLTLHGSGINFGPYEEIWATISYITSS